MFRRSRLGVVGTLVLLLLAVPATLLAQTTRLDTDRVSVVFGLSQIALGGANVEVTYHTRRMVFAWSHGVSLELDGGVRSDDWKQQRISGRMPWTTGFGIGARLTDGLDVRAEFKRHAFSMYPEQTAYRGAPLLQYLTTTAGVGAYYRWRPLANSQHALRGLVIVPSVRYWPNVSSTLAGDSAVFVHPITGLRHVHRAAAQGIPGTNGLFVNASVGYTFGGARRN